MLNKVIISIGSNVDPQANISKGVELLNDKIEIIKITPYIETAPIGIVDQNTFVNGALLAHTLLTKPELNDLLKLIENQVGRDRTQPKFGPREIDLDIVCWNSDIVDDDYYSREFLREFVNWLTTHEND